MSIIDIAVAHYEKMTAAPKQIIVEEWKDAEGNPVILYATPLTVKERIEVQKWSKDDLEIAIEVIIRKATDKDGKPAFTRLHKQQLLRNVDGGILANIARDIIGEYDPDDVKELEKNSSTADA